MSETKCGHIIPLDTCQECESKRPIYTLAELQAEKRKLVDEIATEVAQMDEVMDVDYSRTVVLLTQVLAIITKERP